MEAKPLNEEAIAFTEKKMDMTLDDIIKMSKKKNSRGKRPPRQPIKKRAFQTGNTSQGNPKVQRYMESRSSIRQGVLAQRRSNFRGNQFPVASQAAKKAAAMPIRNRGVRWNKPSMPSTSAQRNLANGVFENRKGKEMPNQKPRTMDALFAHMKEQRMRTNPQQTNVGTGHQFVQRRRIQQRRGRGLVAHNGGANQFR